MSSSISTEWDVVVIGAGPAGYVAAIRCAQRGLKTVCIDEWLSLGNKPSLGGTCLNVGCIPSKALLESSYLYHQAKHNFEQHGIIAPSVELDIKAMQARKKQVVSELTQGVHSLFKANGVEQIHGHAKITAVNAVEVSSRESQTVTHELTTANIIIATGSSSVHLQQLELVEGYILDSSGALALDDVPGRLGIVGGGAIGLEVGSIWSRLGSQVVILEAMHEFLPMVDSKLSRLLKRSLTKQSLDIRLDTRMVSAEIKDKQVHMVYESKAGKHKEVFDKLVVAVGRKPNSDRLFGSEGLGIERDERSFIMVDEHCQTSVPSIYAIGDVIGGPMLAHKGSEEGIMVAEHIAGHFAEVNYDLIPSVIYTHPEIAWVGKNEDECKAAGLNINVGSFPLTASGRARAMGETEGMVKIIADAESDAVLGVHILSAQASELIAQAVLMMEMEATAEDIAMTMFAHPSLSEAIHEAALSVHGKAIHIKN